MPYMNDNATKVGQMYNYFNVEDNALSWWETNNQWKPHETSGYGYKDNRGGIETYEPDHTNHKMGIIFTGGQRIGGIWT